ncbi:MAG: choice-of-anchor V domain-containing protein [Pseudomonadota bacterium]
MQLLSLRASFLLSAVAALVLAGVAASYPEGAPWGAADHRVDEHCASCHWERDAVMHSASIAIDGLLPAFETGATHTFTLEFNPQVMAASGFQVIAINELGLPGAFEAREPAMSVNDDRSAIRSAEVQRTETAQARWTFRWTAPDVAGQTVQFIVAASAANDDQSPFGDQIHYRTFSADIIDRQLTDDLSSR